MFIIAQLPFSCGSGIGQGSVLQDSDSLLQKFAFIEPQFLVLLLAPVPHDALQSDHWAHSPVEGSATDEKEKITINLFA